MAFKLISDEQLAGFNEDGYVRIPGFLDEEETRILMEAAQADETLRRHAAARKDSQGLTSQLSLWHKPGESVYGLVARCRRMVDSAERILGEEVYHWHSKMMMKEPRVGGAWEWHQDYGYWYHDHCLYPHLVSCMVAVTPASRENGCLQVLRGSHKLGRVQHTLTGEQAGADLERVEQAREHHELVYCELEPGEALFFHCNILHRSDANRSEHPRWSLICCYNTKSNSPYRPAEHPSYEPLAKVDDAAIRSAGVRTIDEAAGFIGMDTRHADES